MKRLFSHKQKKIFSYFFLGLFALSIIVPILACFFAVSPLHEVKAAVNRYSVGYTNDDLEYVQSPYYEVGSYQTAVLQSSYDSLKNIAVANGFTMPDYLTWVSRLYTLTALSGDDSTMIDYMFNNQSYEEHPWLADSLVNVYCELDGSIAYLYWIVSPRVPHVAYLSPIDNNNIAIGCNEYPIIFTGTGNDNFICGMGSYTYLRLYGSQQTVFFNPFFRYSNTGFYHNFTTQLGAGQYSSIYGLGDNVSVAHVFAYSLQYQAFNPTLSSVQPLSNGQNTPNKPQDYNAIYNNLFLLRFTSASNYTFARCQYSLSTSFLTYMGYTSYSLNHGIYNLQSSYIDSVSGLELDCLKAVGVGLNSTYNPYVGDSPFSIFYLDSFTFEPFYPTPTPIPTSLPTITPTPLPLEYDSHIDGYEDGSVNGFLNTLKGYFDNLGSAFSVIPWLASSIGYMFYYLGPFSVFLFIPLIAFISFLLGRNKS